MDLLITDLLKLSRLTRSEIVGTPLDMHALAQTAYHDVVPAESERAIVFSIDPLPKAFGDAVLICQVWANLISNAVKYTRGKTGRLIHVGVLMQEETPVYFVRDNGVGFNPQYAHKLFGVFQRLHRADEFEGNGVGLAIVQRIIQRHGGQVWGEGRVGVGATFYFTLPAPGGKK